MSGFLLKNEIFLFQNATIVTNVSVLLQNVKVITKCDI